MLNTIFEAKKHIAHCISEAIETAIKKGELIRCDLPDIMIEQPTNPEYGDFSCNIAMLTARIFKKPPIKIAETIVSFMTPDKNLINSVEVAGAGFINFRLSNECYIGSVKEAILKGIDYGKSDIGQGKRVMVEYVSANPTGPMHLGNARGGALGDCLASVMEEAGYTVYREFYINDAGNQIEKFGLSLDCRYQQLFLGEDAVPLPEDSYHGADIIDRAKGFAKKHGNTYLNKPERERRKALVEYALPLNIRKMQRDMKKYRIVYNKWFRESSLHKSGQVKQAIALLEERGMTYWKDDALWYKATTYGADKDEVLIRANGNPTYYAADIAYHINKFKRGFDICIDVWGADHHGHVARMKGALEAVGYKSDRLEVILMQLVRLMDNGTPVKMSKRTGKAIQLADLLDEVPIDAARFFFNLHESTSKIDFDLGLAVRQDSQNPVYYVQYAHARICSILKAYEEKYGKFNCDSINSNDIYISEIERELIRVVAEYPQVIAQAALEREPSRVNRYIISVASTFHKFYNACRVISSDETITKFRIAICSGTKQVLFNALTLMKITCPDHMDNLTE